MVIEDSEETSSTRTVSETELVKGFFRMADNTVYLGEWSKDKNYRSGYGKSWNVETCSKFEGRFKKDLPNGKGRIIHSDGQVYEGTFLEGMANGKGLYINSNGARYYGDWVNDKQNGYGEEIWPDCSVYVGQYEDGKKHGFGKFVWPDNTVYEG